MAKAGWRLPPPPRAAVATVAPSWRLLITNVALSVGSRPLSAQPSTPGDGIQISSSEDAWCEPLAEGPMIAVSWRSAKQPRRRRVVNVLSLWRSSLLAIFLRHHRPFSRRTTSSEANGESRSKQIREVDSGAADKKRCDG
uniref:Uncharacterized protein n=1 Tax=Oryza meridionalis TaxID=40149 RepID=A0A0E0E1W7_9ORYZ